MYPLVMLIGRMLHFVIPRPPITTFGGRLDRGIQKTPGCPLEPVPAGSKWGTCGHDEQETFMNL